MLACDDVEMLCLSFEEEDGGADVTEDNVKEYVRLRAKNELIGRRRRRLEAMRRGFNDVPLSSHLRLFSVFELAALVCGKQTITAAELDARLKFSGFFGAHSETPGHLREVLQDDELEEPRPFRLEPALLLLLLLLLMLLELLLPLDEDPPPSSSSTITSSPISSSFWPSTAPCSANSTPSCSNDFRRSSHSSRLP